MLRVKYLGPDAFEIMAFGASERPGSSKDPSSKSWSACWTVVNPDMCMIQTVWPLYSLPAPSPHNLFLRLFRARRAKPGVSQVRAAHTQDQWGLSRSTDTCRLQTVLKSQGHSFCTGW